MDHNNLKDDSSGDHWAVGCDTFHFPDQPAMVLVQLQENGEQVRVGMTPDQAEAMARQLLERAAAARASIPYMPVAP